MVVLFVCLLVAQGAPMNKHRTFPAVSPSTFQCTMSTPAATPVWSDTSPKVALTHIFCGEIVNSGAAQGFHSLPDGKDPVCVITSGSCASYEGFPCRDNVQIYDSDTKKYVTKTPIVKNQLFFTESIVDTVNYLIGLYKSSQCYSKVAQNQQLCVQDNEKGIAVAMYIVNSSKDILTAYPLRPTDISTAGCDATCKYP